MNSLEQWLEVDSAIAMVEMYIAALEHEIESSTQQIDMLQEEDLMWSEDYGYSDLVNATVQRREAIENLKLACERLEKMTDSNGN